MNETTIYLSQLIGAYLILVGILCILRRKFFIHAVKDFLQNRAMRFIIPFIELIAGLALVLAHNVWVWGPEVIVTFVGWMMIVEALAYALVPEKKLVKVLSMFNKNGVYVWGGLLSIVAGAYLASVGFAG